MIENPPGQHETHTSPGDLLYYQTHGHVPAVNSQASKASWIACLAVVSKGHPAVVTTDSPDHHSQTCFCQTAIVYHTVITVTAAWKSTLEIGTIKYSAFWIFLVKIDKQGDMRGSIHGNRQVRRLQQIQKCLRTNIAPDIGVRMNTQALVGEIGLLSVVDGLAWVLGGSVGRADHHDGQKRNLRKQLPVVYG